MGYHSLLRCWDLSAGNLKWIVQVPILASIVVSTGWLQGVGGSASGRGRLGALFQSPG